MQELILSIVAAVAAGLILHFMKKGPSITKSLIQRFPRIVKHHPSEKLLIYLSSGGTCRDPMAKAITQKALQGRTMPFGLRIEGMGLGPASKKQVSYAARKAIKDMYGEDLLADHVPETVTKELLDKADLILVMDRALMMSKILPREETYVFKQFFGFQVDIKDPWPDGKDQQTLSRYRECAAEIKTILESNVDRLLDALHA